jgi:flagellar biosynthetic protein FlhB
MLAENAFAEVQQLFVQVGSVANNPEPAALSVLMGQALMAFMTTVLPTALAMMVVGTVAAAAQGGVTFATKSMKPTLKKLNPFPGIKRMFGTQGLWEAVKALIKTAALATVVLVTSDKAQALVASAGSMSLAAVAKVFTDSAILMFRVVAVTGLVIAVADYVIVRMKTMKKLKMSKYEIEQEHKQSEGDPHMKAHRRSVQMSMSRNRMMAEVAEADVLLVNPVHVAVALKYEAAKGAPRVVAKGAGEVAAKLRERAMEARVPLVQDIPLARALHSSCEIGQEVPAQLFTAVARVLAFVRHLGARGVKGGFHRPGFEPPDVSDLPRAGRRRALTPAA